MAAWSLSPSRKARERSRWRRAVLIPAVGGLALGLGIWPAAAALPREAGVVTSVSGQVAVRRAAGDSKPLKHGDPLYWGDTVEVPQDGNARVLIKGKGTVTVRALSRLEIREERRPMGAGYSLDFVLGKLHASVNRALLQEGEQPQEKSRAAVASVRG